MLKMIGCALIVIACSAYGIVLSLEDRFRLEELESFKRLLTVLKSQITFSSMVLKEAFEEGGKRVLGLAGVTADVFSNKIAKNNGDAMETLWKESLQDALLNSHLKQEDKNTLAAFGRCLGYLDKSQQLYNIDMTIQAIENTQSTLRLRAEKNARVTRSMGVLMGLLIAVVLL